MLLNHRNNNSKILIQQEQIEQWNGLESSDKDPGTYGDLL